MSDTPRTDAQIIQFGDGPAKYVYASFAAILERELAEFRKDKERLDWLQSSDLTLNHWEEGPVWCKKGLWTIREYIDAAMANNPTKENNMSKEQEQRIINILVNEALRADKERLEWLLENAIIQYYPTTHPDDLYRITSKDDVDDAMKGE